MKEKIKIRPAKIKNILIALFILTPFFAFAASEYESRENVIAGIIGTAGTGATYELNLNSIFADSENFGQDLYKIIYNRVKHEGSDIAIKRTLSRRPLSKEELLILAPGANISELLKEENPAAKTDPAEVMARLDDLQREFVDEKEIADLESLLKTEVQPTEIFSNGDLGDSGFDLIEDLNIIEFILFGRVENVSGGAGAGAPAESNVMGVGLPRERTGSRQSQALEGREREPQPSRSAVAAPAVSEQHEEMGAACPLNQSFHDAVTMMRDAEKSAALHREQAAEDRGEGTGGRGGQAAESGGSGSVSGEFAAEQPDDWLRPRVCGSAFCLTVDRVYKKESSYIASENCIACHFEKINDAFKKTFNHGLVPGKATGNLIEGPKCKRSLFNLKWNFILIPQPILTPPNDDLVPKGDFIKNAIKFYEKYYDNPGRCDSKSVGGACKPDPDPAFEAAGNLLNQASPETSQSQILLNLRKQVAAKKAEAEALMEETRLENDAENQSTQFQVLMQELNAMNGYFEGFLQLYRQLASDDEEAPCKLLLNKETCR